MRAMASKAHIFLLYLIMKVEVHIVYIVKCANNTFYVGCTSNLENRLRRHSKGEVISTKNRLPVELITHINFTDKYKAYDFEKYLKSGSGRAFMNKRFI